MNDRDPIRTASRKTRRQDRLGVGSFCLFCLYAGLEALTRVSRRRLEAAGISADRIRRLLERHHIFGVAHDPDAVVTLCLNCHREITEGIAREGISMRPTGDPNKRVASGLRGSAVVFDSLAKTYLGWAEMLDPYDENGISMHPAESPNAVIASDLRRNALTFESFARSFRNWADLLDSHD